MKYPALPPGRGRKVPLPPGGVCNAIPFFYRGLENPLGMGVGWR